MSKIKLIAKKFIICIGLVTLFGPIANVYAVGGEQNGSHSSSHEESKEKGKEKEQEARRVSRRMPPLVSDGPDDRILEVSTQKSESEKGSYSEGMAHIPDGPTAPESEDVPRVEHSDDEATVGTLQKLPKEIQHIIAFHAWNPAMGEVCKEMNEAYQDPTPCVAFPIGNAILINNTFELDSYLENQRFHCPNVVINYEIGLFGLQKLLKAKPKIASLEILDISSFERSFADRYFLEADYRERLENYFKSKEDSQQSCWDIWTSFICSELSLDSLSVGIRPYDRREIEALLGTVSTSVTRLRISCGEFNDYDLQKLVTALPNLRTLALFQAPTVTTAGLKHLHGLANLTELCLCDATTGDMVQVVAQLPKLKTLHLDCLKIQEADIECLSQLDNLTTLTLKRFKGDVLRSLNKLNHLRTLNIGDHGWTSYSKTVKDSDLGLIPNTLIELNLSFCNEITDKGLLSLVQHCPQLRKLNLSSCGAITGEGLEQLADLGTLFSLNVKDVKCSEVEEKCLLERLPHLRVYVTPAGIKLRKNGIKERLLQLNNSIEHQK